MTEWMSIVSILEKIYRGNGAAQCNAAKNSMPQAIKNNLLASRDRCLLHWQCWIFITLFYLKKKNKKNPHEFSLFVYT